MKSTAQIIEENAVVWQENGENHVVFECMDYQRLARFIDEIKLAAMKEGAERAVGIIKQFGPHLKFSNSLDFANNRRDEILAAAEKWTASDLA